MMACQAPIEKPAEGHDSECKQCGRVWYATGWDDAPVASRPQRVLVSKRLFTEDVTGEKLDDLIRPVD